MDDEAIILNIVNKISKRMQERLVSAKSDLQVRTNPRDDDMFCKGRIEECEAILSDLEEIKRDVRGTK